MRVKVEFCRKDIWGMGSYIDPFMEMGNGVGILKEGNDTYMGVRVRFCRKDIELWE